MNHSYHQPLAERVAASQHSESAESLQIRHFDCPSPQPEPRLPGPIEHGDATQSCREVDITPFVPDNHTASREVPELISALHRDLQHWSFNLRHRAVHHRRGRLTNLLSNKRNLSVTGPKVTLSPSASRTDSATSSPFTEKA